jgi:threonine synthase
MGHRDVRFTVSCSKCGRNNEINFFHCCKDCDGIVEFCYRQNTNWLPSHPANFWDYFERLPLNDRRNIVTLGEGMTPLLAAKHAGRSRIFWKNEAANPTGSQKDRAVSLAISVAVENSFRRIIVASTGSVGVSCAAYCAKAGLPCLVVVPRSTPIERLLPMLAFGAKVLAFPGTFAQIKELLERLDPARWYQASTVERYNCYQGEGPKTIAFEIFQQLGQIPDWIVVPVGGGGTLHGIWKGFVELAHDGLAEGVPRIVGVQSATFNLLERIGKASSPFNATMKALAPDEAIETICRNLKHGVPPDGENALRAVRSCGGRFISVADADALSWQLRLAREEGLFCEPSSAVTGAAMARLLSDATIKPGETAVGVLTGAGLRETSVLSGLAPIKFAAPITPVDLESLYEKEWER